MRAQHLVLRLAQLASEEAVLAEVWPKLAEWLGNPVAVVEPECQPLVEPLRRPVLPVHLPWPAWDQTHSHQSLGHPRQPEVAQ